MLLTRLTGSHVTQYHMLSFEPCHEISSLMPYMNNKDVDQPAQLLSIQYNTYICYDQTFKTLGSLCS